MGEGKASAVKANNYSSSWGQLLAALGRGLSKQ